jgi:hypothetical protein
MQNSLKKILKLNGEELVQLENAKDEQVISLNENQRNLVLDGGAKRKARKMTASQNIISSSKKSSKRKSKRKSKQSGGEELDDNLVGGKRRSKKTSKKASSKKRKSKQTGGDEIGEDLVGGKRRSKKGAKKASSKKRKSKQTGGDEISEDLVGGKRRSKKGAKKASSKKRSSKKNSKQSRQQMGELVELNGGKRKSKRRSSQKRELPPSLAESFKTNKIISEKIGYNISPALVTFIARKFGDAAKASVKDSKDFKAVNKKKLELFEEYFSKNSKSKILSEIEKIGNDLKEARRKNSKK